MTAWMQSNAVAVAELKRINANDVYHSIRNSSIIKV